MPRKTAPSRAGDAQSSQPDQAKSRLRARPAVPALEVSASHGMPLGMPPSRFLTRYWQKHPLLIRGALAGWQVPITPEDLAGLACEETALARIVLRERKRASWTLQPGPYSEATFTNLPERDWTLLVQDVDKWDAEVAGLLDFVRFLPTWRIDDVMVSYATDGGGVGPHIDQYDVFLVQGIGKRRWSISTERNAPRGLRTGTDLKLLAEFTPTHDFVLEPGDILYLPPDIPHDGVAEGACMTFSIGMRAPAESELLLDLAEHLAEQLPDTRRYSDPDLRPARAPGLIDSAALARVRAQLGPFAQRIKAGELALWFGCMITRYRSAAPITGDGPPASLEQVRAMLLSGRAVLRHPFARFAWIEHGAEGASLFAAGHIVHCPRALAETLCANARIEPDDAVLRDSSALTALRDLLAVGCVQFARAPRKRA
jgi:50S ribosomal protein L16 3-hydroxylase